MFRSLVFNGFVWTFSSNLINFGSTFIVGIVLARILQPIEFGQIAIATLFINFLPIFANGGLSSALIRDNESTQIDYNVAFYYNIFVSVILYVLLFLSSNKIALYFNDLELENIIKVLGLNILLSSVVSIKSILLVKDLNFGKIAFFNTLSVLFSSIISVLLAIDNYGTWALVIKTLLQTLIYSALIYVTVKWTPSLSFNFSSFKKNYTFGSKLMLVSIIDTLFANIFTFVIGKYYSSVTLGKYSRAEQFVNLPSRQLTTSILTIVFPVLSKVNQNNEILKNTYKKFISITMFFSFLFLFGLFAMSSSLVNVLIGEKWMSSVIYLKLLCFPASLYPLHALNLNMLSIVGRSDLFLKVEVIKKILLLPAVFIGVFLNIELMLVFFIVISFLNLVINLHYTKQLINYGFRNQLFDIKNVFLISFVISLIIYLLEILLKNYLPQIILTIQFFIWLILIFISIAFLNIKEMHQIKSLLKDRVSNFISLVSK